MNTKLFERRDFAMGMQNASSWKLRQPNEIENGRNLRFNEEIGAMVRRNGYEASGSQFTTTDKLPCGSHTAHFTTGSKKLVAVPSDDNSATLVRVQNTNGTWTTLINNLPAGVDVYFTDYRDEVFISGYTVADGVPFQPVNIDKALDISYTRNLLFAPYAKYFIVYRGLLYAVNVKIGSDLHPDRFYKSSAPTGAITFIRGAQTGTLTSLKVDSTRYLKVGMAIDIYNRLTQSKIYDLTITAVDKVNNTISFSSTSVTVANNDEIYLDGAYGKLTTFWNTDFPTPDRADWSAVQPGADSSLAIVGGAESAGRLFLFTDNSTNRFDGTNTIIVSKVIGCASMRTIKSLDDDWLIWLTSRARVYARNEASGQQEYISRGLYNKFFKNLTLTQLRSAAAGITDGEYFVYVGIYDGEPSRAVYDFGSNTWSIDALGHPSLMYVNDVADGVIKPFFFSNNGKLYQDDTGHKDDDKITRFQANLGKTNYGTIRDKYFIGHYIYSKYAVGTKIAISIDDREPLIVGEILANSGDIYYPVNSDKDKYLGSTINVILMSAVDGPPQEITSVDDYFNMAQEINAHARKQ